MSSEAHYLPHIAEDVAFDVQSGAVCSECQEGFTGAHGHPTLCKWCWDHMGPADRDGYRRATLDTHAVAIGKSRSRAKRTR